MTAKVHDIMEYIVFCVAIFADVHEISRSEAYRYLRQYKGIQFVQELYDVLHPQSIFDVVDDMTLYCKNNGGTLT